MLLTLMSNLGMFGTPPAAGEGDTHDAPPPWIRTKAQIDQLRKKAEEMRAKAQPEIVEKVEELIEQYSYEVGPQPYIDWQGMLEQIAALEEMERLYALYLQQYNAMILADDEAFLAALVASGEIL